MDFRVACALAVISLSSLSSVYSSKCYSCIDVNVPFPIPGFTATYHKDCASSDTSKYADKKVDCGANVKGCVKAKTKSGDTELTIRSCPLAGQSIQKDECVDQNGVKVCGCTREYCNDSAMMRAGQGLVVMSFFTAVFVALVQQR